MTEMVKSTLRPVPKKDIKFWSTSFYTAVSTSARLISQFVVAKLISVFAGAPAFGLFGQFLSFVSIIQLGSGGVIRSGVIKYSSEYFDDESKLRKLLQTAFTFSIILSLLTGGIIALLSKQLSLLLFHSISYRSVLILFGFFLVT
jgi:PST family polysaccharide transporter